MDKQSKAAELNAGIRNTIEQLANGTDAARQSELFRNYLKTSAAFYHYSWHNQMLIWKQKPDASFVGGFNTWLKCGRYVRKGEKGIAILAPMFFKDKRQMPDGSEGESKRIWFKVVYVFDISQTDGTPLPELPTKSTGERGADMLTRLLAFAESRGITVRFVEQCCLNGAAGTSRGNEIEIRTADIDITTQAATLAHEIAHSLLHWDADGHKITTRDGREIGKQQRELEAEAVAYVVGSYFGIQSPSDFYLATYRVTPAMLLEAVETIAKTVKTVLEGCQQVEPEPEGIPMPSVPAVGNEAVIYV
ncbi:MAG: ArdC-like ssDNA-binding domain-containing protein [Candidatus Sulfotelmatobacter sp.]